MSTTAAPEFYIDEATHTYWYRGRQIPGISHVLKELGYIDTAYYTERGRDVGHATHLGTVFIDKGTLDWNSITDEKVAGRLHAYERFLREKNFRPEFSEQIFHYMGMYGCRIDRAGSFDTCPRAIVEIKGGAKASWHKIQTAMQERATPGGPRRRFVLYLRPDGTYELVPHTDPSDYFAVNLPSELNWRKNNGY